jgi:transporter family protein
MWVIWGVFSALLLGVYEAVKKVGVDNNAVIPVLFFSTVASSLVFLPVTLLSVFYPTLLHGTLFYVPSVSFHSHLLILLKSVIVVSRIYH